MIAQARGHPKIAPSSETTPTTAWLKRGARSSITSGSRQGAAVRFTCAIYPFSQLGFAGPDAAPEGQHPDLALPRGDGGLDRDQCRRLHLAAQLPDQSPPR